jgi:hypothetical protein
MIGDNMKIETHQVITMPAGSYYIGDLCYVLDDDWDEACSMFFAGRSDHGVNQGGFTLRDGRNFVCFNTAWGDGGYEDNYGRMYGVDAGCIGAIQVPAGSKAPWGGNIVEFKNAFECRKEGRGTLIFGDVIIETDT